MESSAALKVRLVGFRWRVRLLVAEQSALTWGAAAALLCLVLEALDRLRLIRAEWPVVAAVLAAGLAAGWLWGALRRISDFDVARAAEHRLSLKERVSSAVALGPHAPDDGMVQALVEDAAEKLDAASPARLFPRRFDRRGQVLVGLVLLLAAAMILPEIPLFQSAATRQERATLRDQGERLVKLAGELERPQLPKAKQRLLRQLAANLKALGKDMRSLRVSRKEALVRMHKLEKEAQLAKAQLTAAGATKSLARAAAELKPGELATAQQAKLLAQLTSLQAGQPKGKGAGLSEQQMRELEKLAEAIKPSVAQQLLDLDADLASVIAELLAKEDLQAALKILEKLAQKLQDKETLKKLSPEELKRLAEELRKLAEALKETDLDELARRILEMAKALERGDLKACEKAAKGLQSSCLGLGLGLGACDGAIAGLGLCLGSGRGRGIGPGDGMAQHDPNAPHDVNRGTPTRIPTQHYSTRIPGQEGDKGEAYSIQVLGEPDKPGKSRVPYYQVYSDYSKAAEHALDREDIPAAHRQRVKTYFESLRPAQADQPEK